MPRSLLRRGACWLGSAVLLGSLAAVAGLWIAKTRPFDPAQHEVAAVDVAARGFPTYHGAVLVLNYHDVSDSGTSPYTVSPRAFATQLDALHKAGFHTIRLADLEALVAGRPVRLPPRPILLTFDDGPVSNWLEADPALRRYGFTGVAYLISGKVVQPYRPSYFLSTEQVRRMAATGRWEFGGHTDDLHRQAPTPGGRQAPALINRLLVGPGQAETLAQWRARVRADLARNQRFFVGVLGHPVDTFAFPFGAADRPTDDPAIPGQLDGLLEEAGFKLAFTSEALGGELEAPVMRGAAAYRLPRIAVTSSLDAAGLLAALRRTAPDPVTPDLTALHWAGDNARCTVRSSGGGRPAALLVSSDGYGRCAAPVNPVQWTDYRLSTDVLGGDRDAAAYIGVRVRLTPGTRGRAEVVIGESTVRVREQVGSRVKVLATRTLAAGGDRRVDVTVQGDAERVDVTAYASGDRKLVTKQDATGCSPVVTSGHAYQLSAWYKGGPAAFVVFYRDAGGTWRYWTQSPAQPPAQTGWSQATWTTPAVPSGATALSFGLSLAQVGTLTTDDYALTDTTQGQQQPLASPAAQD